ncbi:MAG: hypothetical protein R3C02_24635 [Planctomycetaceae bacterium]
MSIIIPDEELPQGWKKMSLSEAGFESSEPIPTLVSRPDLAGAMAWYTGGKEIDNSKVVRVLFALYRNLQGKPPLGTFAHIYTDEATARLNAEILKHQEDSGRRLHIWRRGELVIGLVADVEMTDEEFQSWVQQVDARLP